MQFFARSSQMVRLLVAINNCGKRIGETHHRAKISDAEVEAILELRFEHHLTYEEIAAKWDDGVAISKSTVRDICKGLTRGQIACRFKAVA